MKFIYKSITIYSLFLIFISFLSCNPINWVSNNDNNSDHFYFNFWRLHENSKGYFFSSKTKDSFIIKFDSSSTSHTYGASELAFLAPNCDSLSIEMEVKTENVTEEAAIWIRTDFSPYEIASWNSSKQLKQNGRSEWKLHKITIPISNSMSEVHIGGLLTGKGKAYYRSLKVKANSKQIQLSDYASNRNALSRNDHSKLNENSIDISATNKSKFENIINNIKNPKIIQIGEVSHGIEDIQKFRTEFIKYLIEQKGYQTILLEESANSGYRCNLAINGEGTNYNSDYIKYYFGFEFYKTETYVGLIKHLRNIYTKSPSNFFGIDMQSSFYELYRLSKITKTKFPELSAQYRSLSDTIDSGKGKKLEKLLHVKAKMEELGKYSSEVLKLGLDNETDTKAYFYLRKNVLQHIFLNTDTINSFRQNRDSLMAENIKYIFESDPDQKIIVLAHNGIVEYNHKSMGYFLRKQFKGQIYTIGALVNSGKYYANDYRNSNWGEFDLSPTPLESYEYGLLKCDQKNYFIDFKSSNIDYLKQPNFFRHTSAVKMDNDFRYSKNGLSNHFDGIIFFDNVSSIKTLSD